MAIALGIAFFFDFFVSGYLAQQRPSENDRSDFTGKNFLELSSAP